MRDGKNPAETSELLEPYKPHHVILPVYIPTLTGYFRHALEVLQLCLRSLSATASRFVDVTIISNGSHPQANEEIEQLAHSMGAQVIVNPTNRGKVDAVIPAARSSFAPLITIADSDVLFREGWLTAVTQVFSRFPSAGFVCPVPSPGAASHHTSSTVLSAFLRRQLFFDKVVDDEDLRAFASSIGRLDLFENNRERQLIVRKHDATACVGAGHFVFTIRREVINVTPSSPSLDALGQSSHELWLDAPVNEAGLWRLSTTSAHAHHMGNVPEPWMEEEVAEMESRDQTGGSVHLGPPPHSLVGILPRRVRDELAKRIRQRLS